MANQICVHILLYVALFLLPKRLAKLWSSFLCIIILWMPVSNHCICNHIAGGDWGHTTATRPFLSVQIKRAVAFAEAAEVGQEKYNIDAASCVKILSPSPGKFGNLGPLRLHLLGFSGSAGPVLLLQVVITVRERNTQAGLHSNLKTHYQRRQ